MEEDSIMGQQIKGDQIKDGTIQPRNVAGLYGPFEITFEYSTVRSTVGSTWTVMPGATGDTSYTAPADQDMTLFFIMTQMTDRTGGQTLCRISVNGSAISPQTYVNGTLWELQTVQCIYNVDAGVTIDIGCLWYNAGGTGEVTNRTSDTQFMNGINYVALPRNA